MSRGSFTQSSDPYWTEQTHAFLIENNSLTNHFPGLSKEKYVPMAVWHQNMFIGTHLLQTMAPNAQQRRAIKS